MNALLEKLREFATTAPAGRVGAALGAALALLKLPLIFRTLGEDDQGRLIMHALSWGPSTENGSS